MSEIQEVDKAADLAARPPSGNLRSASAVRWLQAALNIVLPSSLTVDGIAGGQTRAAVTRFQGQRGLTVDGIAGLQTFTALVRALDAMAAGSAGVAAAGLVPGGPPAGFVRGAQACASLAEPVVLDDFDFDRATLKLRHHDRLAQVALCLRSSPALRRVRIVGHTDPEGDPAYNEGLGLRRAEETRRGLQSALKRVLPGLERAVTIDVESLGERDPASATPAENRRVQVFLGRTPVPVRPKPVLPPPPPPPISPLTRLRRRYFDPGLPTFVENTTAAAIFDGAEYMAAVEAAINRTKGEGDVILVAGWTLDPAMDLRGRLRGSPGFKEVGQLLAEKAALGVTVRIVLNGALTLFRVPGTPFAASFAALLDLRTRRVGGTSPLADSVVWDFSGEPRTGAHHMKSVVTRAGEDVVAFVGGMDLDPGRFDIRTHDLPGKVWIDGSRWGWHDAAVRLKGEGTKAVWATLNSRWEEARTLPPETFLDTRRFPPSFQRFNPPTLLTAPPVPGSVPPSRSPGTALQVLVSRWPEKRPGTPWTGTPSGPIRDVHRAIVAAIRGAQQYIYIEDQFLDNSLMPGSSAAGTSLFPELGAAVARGVKLIMVSSDKGDPGDLPAAIPVRARVRLGLKNRALSATVTSDIIGAPGVVASKVAVWRIEDATVHAKVMIIDDVFAAIGSANLHTRSMVGVDDELHTFIVDSGNRVRSLRVGLWAEHLRIALAGRTVDVDTALENLGTALGMWRRSWLVGGAPGMWFVSGNPNGFAPREIKRVFVGPAPGP